MIASIKIFKEKSWQDLNFVQPHKHKITFAPEVLHNVPTTIQIIFKSPIVLFRSSAYKWHPLNIRLLSNAYSPKILKLDNQQLVQANGHQGIWEVHPKHPKILLWHFNIANSNPLAHYDLNNSKQVIQAISQSDNLTSLAFLFPQINALEVSRSKLPFSAIACFTDHCDFDTLQNLKQQREFFKRHEIKVTKGFFLNHYSKRSDTASCEYHRSEMDAWLSDGHELAYHSLSQSIKPLEASLNDFKAFEPPFKALETWIDHGFQPYNVSLYQHYEPIKSDYGTLLKKKGVRTLWNYIDSGTTAKGVINQLNPVHFTLESYYKGIKHLSLKNRVPMFIKNIIFHFYHTDSSLRIYGTLAKFYKTRHQKKSFGTYLTFVRSLIQLGALLLPILLFWKAKKKVAYPLADYTPVLFRHDITGETFTVFQSLELIDFKTGLHPNNIDLLIKESGLFIAHTYFSAPMNYHHGRLFDTDTEINPQVDAHFEYLSQKITSGELWNPTLTELVPYLENYNALTFDCNEEGVVFMENNDHQLATRDVQ